MLVKLATEGSRCLWLQHLLRGMRKLGDLLVHTEQTFIRIDAGVIQAFGCLHCGVIVNVRFDAVGVTYLGDLTADIGIGFLLKNGNVCHNWFFSGLIFGLLHNIRVTWLSCIQLGWHRGWHYAIWRRFS